MTRGRSRERFDADWRFLKGDLVVPEAVKAGALGGLADTGKRVAGKHDLVAFADREMRNRADPDRWPAVTLPHDFVVGEPFVNEKALQTHGFKPHGVGFYRKVFALPASDAGRKVVLEFDGIFRNSTIWVNGHHLLDHRSGYTSFHVDLTDVARYGAEGLNCVLVRVDARADEGWWYEGGGIYRHVWLTKTDRIHVGRWGTFVTTPRADARRAEVRVETTVDNETGAGTQVTVETVLADARGKRVGGGRTVVPVPETGCAVATQRFTVARPRLWSPATPALYRARTTLRVRGRVVDTYETVFGIRTIRFDPDRGFFLNGIHTPVKGTCNHQDFAGVGVALPDSLHEYKIKVLKDLGANAYRCAHHPPAPELLDACDRLGMMVLDENRRLDSSARGLEDLDTLILRDRNHPSIIIWGMENEERLEGTPMGARILERLVRRAHRLDPTRPTVASQNHGHNALYQGKTDIAGFNYGQNGNKDVAYHRTMPRQPVIGTETNATVSTRGVLADDARRGWVNAYGTAMPVPPYPWSCGFEEAWKAYLANPFLSGVFIWAGFDYRGEPSPYGWPCVNSHYGILDVCGFPKDGAWHHRAQFSEEPVLHLVPHWNRPAPPGRPVPVWALTNCDRVEVIINGKPQGARDVPRGGRAEWVVTWEPGVLAARGWRGGQLVVETKVETTGKAAAVALDPDRARIAADGRDAVPVRVAIRDAAGRVVPDAGPQVRFAVSGPARIIGVGNGDPSSHEPDQADSRRAFNGRCLAILQSTGKRGRVVLTARAPGLKPARCIIKAA